MEGAGVVSGCADKRTPNTGADQVFATPLPTKSSRSQATPDSMHLLSLHHYLPLYVSLLPNFCLQTLCLLFLREMLSIVGKLNCIVNLTLQSTILFDVALGEWNL